MPTHSAGLLVHRRRDGLEVFLVHPGGPSWTRRDEHAWSIPKGEFDPAAEDGLAAARREFGEETGFAVPPGDPVDLGVVRQRSGKVVHAWALEGDLDPDALVSGRFEMEWPPGSGRVRSFPEVDRGAWFPLDLARSRLHAGQGELLDRLVTAVAGA